MASKILTGRKEFSRSVNLCRACSLYEIHIDLTFVLGLYLAPVYAVKAVFHQLIGEPADIDPAHFAAAFHAGCGIDGIAPDIIRKFLQAHNTGNQRTGMNAQS